MNITNHAKLRYVQRVQGIADEKKAKQYLAQNEDEVIEEALSLFEKATYIWTGQINKNQVSHFHLSDDIIFVVDEPKTIIVTIMRCDFGFPDTINKQTIKSLMSEIKKLRERREKRRDKVNVDVAKLEIEIENINAQIDAKKAELETLYSRRNVVDGELTVVTHEIGQIDVEIGSIAIKLLNSVELRSELAARAI